MKKSLKNLMALALGLSLVAFSACSDDDNGAVPSMNGTYAGDIYASIPGLVDSTFTQDFAVGQSSGKTTLSLTLNIPIEAMQGQVVPIPITVELVSLTTFSNKTIQTEDGSVTITGTCFKMSPYSLTIPGIGITISLSGTGDFEIDGVKFDGFQGNISSPDPNDKMNNGFLLNISGTASGGPLPITLPVAIYVEGTKK